MIEFLVTELLPWIHAHCTVTTDPARTVIGGSSYGGLAATYAGLVRPDLFGCILSQSGSFGWRPEEASEHGWLIRQCVALPRLPLRWYMDVGWLEAAIVVHGPSQLLANRHMRDVVRAKGYSRRIRAMSSANRSSESSSGWYPITLRALLMLQNVRALFETP
jgi:pimeloyl-ACP methyl ester carboxylesterase